MTTETEGGPPPDLFLRLYPDPVLRRRATDIKRIDDRVREGAKRMFQIMYESRGIGLAAPQVGWSERIFVVNLAGENGSADQEMVFINPVLSQFAGESTYEEGCLSFPEIHVEVTRPETVRIEAYDLQGEKFTLDASDLLARCLQHENDHLDGILFVTRISNSARLSIRKALKELEKRFAEERAR
ncbi:MAG: peptide deformylase [Planctomycetota bacterium]